VIVRFFGFVKGDDADAGADALARGVLFVVEHGKGGIGVGRHQLRHLRRVLAQERVRRRPLHRQRLL
jgi:hypothetical protein